MRVVRRSASTWGMKSLLHLVGGTLLALLGLSAHRAEAGKFDGYEDCASCVAAGFGWSAERGKCGGYANKECSRAPQDLPARSAQPPHTDSVSSDPIAAAYATQRYEQDSFDVFPGSFVGDDDDQVNACSHEDRIAYSSPLTCFCLL